MVNDKIVAVQKPSTGKGLEESVRQLNDQLKNEVDTKKRAELHAVIKVAELLLTSGPMCTYTRSWENLHQRKKLISWTCRREFEKTKIKSHF